MKRWKRLCVGNPASPTPPEEGAKSGELKTSYFLHLNQNSPPSGGAGGGFMDVTVEVSIYPLHNGYEKTVLEFIANLRKHPSIEVEVNGLSTQIFGGYTLVMNKILPQEIEKVLLHEKAVVVIKLAKGILRFEEDKIKDEKRKNDNRPILSV
jgi:uncharacterized protein YqgV (UPF0045/DUF77 family)